MTYLHRFIPYALAAFLIGIVGGFSSVLGPAFAADLMLPYHVVTWTALAQAMSTAACAPILGRLGDIVGRRRTLLLGLGIFTLGNVLTALAGSLPMMLLARFLVGVGTAAMSPVILAYIVSEFPQDKSAAGLSLYMLISSGSVVFGPTLGSLLIASSGWRCMIWVCVGLCLAIFPGCLFLGQKEQLPSGPAKAFDRPGAALVFLFFSLVLCIPSFGQNFGWTSAPFLLVFSAALVALPGLITVERHASNPILPRAFLGRRSFLLSVVTSFLTQGLMQANMTNTIIFVSSTQPDNTLISGYAISIMYLGMSLGSILLGPLADRIEPRRVLLVSLASTGIGCGLQFLFTQQTPSYLLIGSLGILGFGLGGNCTLLMKSALSFLSPQQSGTGTGIYGLFRDLAAPFGVAVFVPLYTNQIARLVAAGHATAVAAVSAIHILALAELICVGAGCIVAQFLPATLPQKGESS